jgi:hypothetical protein
VKVAAINKMTANKDIKGEIPYIIQKYMLFFSGCNELKTTNKRCNTRKELHFALLYVPAGECGGNNPGKCR